MKTVNVSEMRNVNGGARYKCLICGKKSNSTTLIYWHVVTHGKAKLICGPWAYIKEY